METSNAFPLHAQPSTSSDLSDRFPKEVDLPRSVRDSEWLIREALSPRSVFFRTFVVRIFGPNLRDLFCHFETPNSTGLTCDLA